MSWTRLLADNFETCRRKRNQIDYFQSHVATDTEAAEIVAKAKHSSDMVERWIAGKYPDLAR